MNNQKRDELAKLYSTPYSGHREIFCDGWNACQAEMQKEIDRYREDLKKLMDALWFYEPGNVWDYGLIARNAIKEALDPDPHCEKDDNGN